MLDYNAFNKVITYKKKERNEFLELVLSCYKK